MSYERWVAIACTHGECLDTAAFDVVLAFCRRWKPKRRFLLGDIHDYAAFRAGAKGTADEARRLDGDVLSGATIIERYRPTDVVIGNHDYRTFKLADHPNAITARAAGACVNEFMVACERAKVERILDTYDIGRSWIEYGGCKFLHGFMFCEMALRDHAEHFGNCVMGHLHTPHSMHGRRADLPTAHCVGMLADRDRLEYAHQRRATARWALGFAWGEASETQCIVRIEQCEPGKARDWRLPL